MAITQLRGRLGDWIRRYLPAELLSLAITGVSIWATLAHTRSLELAAVVGTWAENLAYYGVIVGRELLKSERPVRNRLGVLWDLFLEFGPSELLDSFLIRPAALYGGLTLAPLPILGALAGKLAADVLFYLPTIISYELLRRRRAQAAHRPRDGSGVGPSRRPPAGNVRRDMAG